MQRSDSAGFLFRNTSWTMWLRFTPAIACSTRTRVRASLRLDRFSCSGRSPPGRFFFRLTGLAYRRLIPLEPRILVQGGPWRVAQACLVRDPLLVGLTGVGPAQEQHPAVRGADDEHVLVRVRLLLATVVQGLFFGFFRPLSPPLRGVDDDDEPGRS